MGPDRGEMRKLMGAGHSAGTGIALLFLATQPAFATSGDPGSTGWVAFAVSAGAISLALAAGLWALAEQRSASRLRIALQEAVSRARSALSERDALIGAGPEPVMIWSRERDAAASYNGAEALIDSCLAGQDALALSTALDALSARVKVLFIFGGPPVA